MSLAALNSPDQPIAFFKLRESEPPGRVILFKNDVPVFSHSEYRAAAEYAQRVYLLTDDTLMVMYHDYREDYDNR